MANDKFTAVGTNIAGKADHPEIQGLLQGMKRDMQTGAKAAKQSRHQAAALYRKSAVPVR